MSDSITTIVKCPNCQKTVAWLKSQKYRPFCSERCRLIDLGEWMNEENVIKGENFDPENNSE